jgi:hypothetical protein
MHAQRVKISTSKPNLEGPGVVGGGLEPGGGGVFLQLRSLPVLLRQPLLAPETHTRTHRHRRIRRFLSATISRRMMEGTDRMRRRRRSRCQCSSAFQGSSGDAMPRLAGGSQKEDLSSQAPAAFHRQITGQPANGM